MNGSSGKAHPRLAIVVEAIPPYCGGGEQVAWIHATELAKSAAVTVVTCGERYARERRDGLDVVFLPRSKRNLWAYLTTYNRLLNDCIDQLDPDVVHCHMPNVLSACIRKRDRLFVSTIHDGVPEDEMRGGKFLTSASWLRFKLIRRVNVVKSDAVTCVSRHNREVMTRLYPRHAAKFSFIPNPIYERFFAAPTRQADDGFVLNFGRQTALKMGALLEVARSMPDSQFVFVGTGAMVRDHGLGNVQFAGFSTNVIEYIDRAALCVFPSLSENFPLVGLEAMARGKVVIATSRGFSEYIEHMVNGYLLSSTEPAAIRDAIRTLLGDEPLRKRIGEQARATALRFRAGDVCRSYSDLYTRLLAGRRVSVQ